MVITGDAKAELDKLQPGSINCCVTSPPYYGLRDYGSDGQIGTESDVASYIEKLITVFRSVKNVLRNEGTAWVNLGDTYCSKTKQLLGVPWRFAFAMQADGWILRQDVIWHKPNPMPESVLDRCVKSHEYLFLFAKNKKYHFETIKEPATYAGQKRGGSKKRYAQNAAGMDNKVYDTRTKRSVWSVRPAHLKTEKKHFAIFPPELIRPCILASCPAGGVVLDPFGGSGTTGVVARQEGRQFILIELNTEYAELAKARAC